MPITFRCPNGHTIKARNEFAGRSAKCPTCRVEFEVPRSPTPDQGGASVGLVDAPGEWTEFDEVETFDEPEVFDSADGIDDAPAFAAKPGQPLPAKADKDSNPADLPGDNRQLYIPIVVASIAVAALVLLLLGVLLVYRRNSVDTASADPTGSPHAFSSDPPDKPASVSRREAPISDTPALKLLERADHFAMNPESGELAAVQQQSNNLYLYSPEYLASGSGKVRGPIDAGRVPGPVAFKRIQDKAYFVVADTNDAAVRCFDAQTLQLVHTIRSPCRHNTSVCTPSDPTDSRVYFCANPYPPGTHDDDEYYICVGDLSSPESKVVFHAQVREPEACYVSPRGGFLYGRQYQYPFAIFLEQNELDEMTISGHFISISNDTTYESLVIDPSGASVAFKDSLRTPDLETELFKYDFAVQCYLLDRPCVAGLHFDRVKRGGPIVGLSLKIAGLDKPDVLHNVRTDFHSLPSGLAWNNSEHQRTFLTESGVFHSLASDSIVAVHGDSVINFPLENIDLPTGPSPLPVFDYPSRTRVGKPFVVKMGIPADPDTTFALRKGPEGAILKDGVLNWTPGDDQTGRRSMQISWSQGGRSGETTIKLFVDDSLGTMGEDKQATRALATIGIQHPDDRQSTANEQASRSPAPVKTATGLAYQAPFEVDQVYGNWSGDAALVLGWDTPPRSSRNNPVDVTTHCAVINLKSGVVEAERDIPLDIVDAAIDSHHVYLKGPRLGRGSPVLVLSRGDLASKLDLVCEQQSAFGAFADRIFVSTHVYSVPSMKIIRTDHRPKNRPFRTIIPPIPEHRLRDFFRRDSDGMVVNAVQYDAQGKNPQMVYGVDVLGIVRGSQSRNRSMNDNGESHPTLPLQMTLQYRKDVRLSVYPQGGNPSQAVKEYSLGDSQNRFTGRPVAYKDFALAPAGGTLHRVDLRGLQSLDFPSHPKFVARQIRFLVEPNRPTVLAYTIEGGAGPYTVKPQGSGDAKQTVSVDGNKVRLQVTYSDVPRPEIKNWISEAYSEEASGRDFLRQVTGFPDTPPRGSVQDRFIRDVTRFCTKTLKQRVSPGTVPLPVPVFLEATDSNGFSCQVSHWLFVTVKEEEFRNAR